MVAGIFCTETSRHEQLAFTMNPMRRTNLH